MATRTIVTCDVCGTEIKDCERRLRFSAKRWGMDATKGWGVLVEFNESEFCSDSCVINAVRGLLNG